MSSLDTGERYVAPVSGFSGSNNPIITNGDIDKKIVVIVDDSDMKKGKLVDCIIQKEHGDHYQALRTSDAPVTKPDRSGEPNVPIHHDGEHGESVGDTRNEYHSHKSVEEREFNPKTHGAPPISRSGGDFSASSKRSNKKSDEKSLHEIADDIYSDEDHK